MISLGALGNLLTTVNFQIATVLAHDNQLEFDSVLDLLNVIKILGESGLLRGRRKGVYKELLLAVAALYTE